MKFTSLLRSFAVIGSLGFAASLAACDAGGTGVMPTDPPDDPSTPGNTSLAISFLPMGPTDTRCGTAAGVHVQINDGNGDVQTCDAKWAPAELNGQPVADCLFVVHPGTWMVDSVSIINNDNQPLECCEGSWPDSVSVEESSTTEFGAAFTCETVSNGALDIFATVNRPPTIENLTVSPSKFGNTCSLITLGAQGSDPDGDGVSFGWFVVSGPSGGDWAIAGRGATAYFLGATVGDYQLRLTATDDYGATHYLDFPIHLTGGGVCDADERLDDLLP